MYWRIYFIIFTLISSMGLFALIRITQFNLSDYLLFSISVYSVIGLYCFIFQKEKVLGKKYWKLLFISSIIITLTQVVYELTDITFLANILKPHVFGMSDLTGNNKLIYVLINIFALFISLPLYFALYALGYKDLKKIRPSKNVKKIQSTKTAKIPPIVIGSILLSLLGFLFGPLTGIPAIITAILGLKRIEKSEGKLKGNKIAWTAIVLSLLQFVLLALMGIVLAFILRLPGLLSNPDEAVNNMTAPQRTYYEKSISKIDRNSTRNELDALLGNPSSTAPMADNSITYSYKCPNELVEMCTVNVTMKNGKVESVGWADLRRFFYMKTYID